MTTAPRRCKASAVKALTIPPPIMAISSQRVA
ncbi:hypothetical protein YPPY36_3327, partial [Yersinia pestis PY-36]